MLSMWQQNFVPINKSVKEGQSWIISNRQVIRRIFLTTISVISPVKMLQLNNNIINLLYTSIIIHTSIMNNFSHIWFVNSHSKGHCGYNALKRMQKMKWNSCSYLQLPYHEIHHTGKWLKVTKTGKKVGNTV